jgi:hypothetical protein
MKDLQKPFHGESLLPQNRFNCRIVLFFNRCGVAGQMQLAGEQWFCLVVKPTQVGEI